MSSTTAVKINILDKEYLIGCPESERESLLRSADMVHRKMREARDSGKVIGAERIAVMVALNLAHELLQAQSETEALRQVRERLSAMDEKLAGALNGSS
ncbi:cell division protein ZapA [Alkalilimnicola sp. S0819]|uniref:cell division protein ZapA n=1 Tax=Alkalilimnicola sp. S0819 TaxID=2613922 RepID=UPI00126288E6|nr:cell division protein ZapA [Alkalilimnicola sp. S0819]KAB7628206.1 cell division protein ZapA [Alkalilimnicola sp. S0819]MPQ15097.1 cell division protein ZapA [Alkalilimnicola sp. S0819]